MSESISISRFPGVVTCKRYTSAKVSSLYWQDETLGEPFVVAAARSPIGRHPGGRSPAPKTTSTRYRPVCEPPDADALEGLDCPGDHATTSATGPPNDVSA